MLEERGDVEGLAIPETVQALMTARLDTLRPSSRALLARCCRRRASLLERRGRGGRRARSREVTRRELNELVRREFVRPVRVSSIDGEDEFSFWHALVRDVAYQQIPRAPRAEKHVAAAAGSSREPEERVADHAEILVHHYGAGAGASSRSAGDERPESRERLVRFLVLAGDRRGSSTSLAAEAYYRRALELVDRRAQRAGDVLVEARRRICSRRGVCRE